jgi:hypothetical protein
MLFRIRPKTFAVPRGCSRFELPVPPSAEVVGPTLCAAARREKEGSQVLEVEDGRVRAWGVWGGPVCIGIN